MRATIQYPIFILTLFVLIVFPGCNEHDHADYGTSTTIGGGGGSSSGGDDSDGGTDTDTDTETDYSPCDTDEVYHEDEDLCWRICPVGQEWDGSTCTGTATLYEQSQAVGICPSLALKYTTASLYAFMSILDDCEDDILTYGISGVCDNCAASETCNDLFGADTEIYWTSTSPSDSYTPNWTVDLADGTVMAAYTAYDLYAVRCLW